MKRLLSFIIAIEILGLITACQTTSTGGGAASQKETLLLQAGFKPKTVTTPKQQERVSALPEGKVSAVNTRDELITCIPLRLKIEFCAAPKRSSMPTNRPFKRS